MCAVSVDCFRRRVPRLNFVKMRQEISDLRASVVLAERLAQRPAEKERGANDCDNLGNLDRVEFVPGGIVVPLRPGSTNEHQPPFLLQ